MIEEGASGASPIATMYGRDNEQGSEMQECIVGVQSQH